MRSNRFPFLFLAVVLACAVWLFNAKNPIQDSKPASTALLKTSAPAETKSNALAKAAKPSSLSVAATDILNQSIAALREIQFAAQETKFEAFNHWAADFLANENPSSEALTQGLKLAQSRRDEMSDLIQSYPDRALELTFPRELRKSLPGGILALLEKPFSAKADLTVMGVLAAPGETVRPIERRLILEGQIYDAYVYGRRLGEPTRFQTALHGITLGDFAAIAEEPVRPMTVGEINLFKARQTAEDLVCSYTGLATASKGTETIVEAEGKVFPLCEPGHISNLGLALAASGGDDETPALGSLELGASPYTEGTKTLVIIRVDFEDLAGDPFSLSSATNLVTGLNTFYRTNSYGKTGLAPLGEGSVVTPTFRMSETAAYYGANDASRLRSAARDAARAAGYNLANYQFDLICFGNVPGFSWAGLGYIGAPGSWIRGGASVGVTAHELGHNLGLMHANFWDTAGQSVIGSGTTVEYGDKFDTMGNASGGGKHFNARYKNLLNWLGTADVKAYTTNGTYRINPHDRGHSTGLRALRITKNASTNYWVEFRANYGSNKWLTNGVTLRWAAGGTDNRASLLLDTTPGSADGTDDAAVMIGKTFTDKVSGVHITPVAIGETNAYVDVTVNKGAFLTNLPPMVILSSDKTNAVINGPINFNVDVADPNGDELAYYWQFGDGSFSSNKPAAVKRWSASGEYVVQCFVSDMKGGVTTKSQLVKVGSPTTYRIGGRVLNGTLPLAGVTLAAGARTTVTDSEGRYYLTGLPAGSYTLKASLEGYIFSRSGFSNPLSVGPSRDTADFFGIQSNTQTTSALVPGGSAWKFWDRGASLGTAWRAASYNDGTWNEGPAPLGYGEDNEKTEVSFGPDSSSKYITTYFRKKFTVEDKQSIAGLTLGLKRDDGGIVYLNNREVFRSNMPSGTIDYTTRASSTAGGGDENTFFETEIDPAWLNNGTNVLAVEIHQSSGTSSDITFDLRLFAINADAAAPPPTVQSQIVGSSLRLTWPDSAATWTIASSTDLYSQGLGGVWTEVTAPISLSNGQRSATIPLESGPRFFRLQR